MDGESPNLAPLEIGESVGRIEQEAPGIHIQRDRNRVDGEVAPPEVFHDGGKTDFRLCSRMRVNVFARGGDTRVNVAGEDEFHVADVLIFAYDVRAALLELPDNARRIPFHGEIQVADRHSRGQVANGAANEIEI